MATTVCARWWDGGKTRLLQWRAAGKFSHILQFEAEGRFRREAAQARHTSANALRACPSLPRTAPCPTACLRLATALPLVEHYPTPPHLRCPHARTTPFPIQRCRRGLVSPVRCTARHGQAHTTHPPAAFERAHAAPWFAAVCRPTFSFSAVSLNTDAVTTPHHIYRDAPTTTTHALLYRAPQPPPVRDAALHDTDM